MVREPLLLQGPSAREIEKSPAAGDDAAALMIDGKAVPKETNIWEHQEEQSLCNTCEHYTGQIDRQSDPANPKWLKWSKVRKVKKGNLLGVCSYVRECHACCYERQAEFAPMDQKELCTHIKEDPEEDQKFWKGRKNNVLGI